MTIELPGDLEDSIRATVLDGLFPSMDAAMAEAVRRLLEQVGRNEVKTPTIAPPAPDASPPEGKPAWERILERSAQVPEEEWDQVPIDLAEQHDHYLYGVPKRTRA